MKSRAFDPHRLDVEAFAAEAAAIEGEWPLADLPRVADVQVADTPPRTVEWHARGERRTGPGSTSETWMVLQLRTTLDLPCQRCLDPVEVPVVVDRGFRFVADESTAEALDAEIDDDVLASTRALDLRSLIEDELLLALPLVPRHDVCPQPVKMQSGDDTAGREAHPFAALAALKKPSAPG